jgi:hypothetical protein
MHETTISCKFCPKKLENHRFEFHLDLNLELPANQATTLEELIISHFKEEEIEGYNCIKCSLREYLSKFLENF